MDKETWSDIVYRTVVMLDAVHAISLMMGNNDPVELIEERAAMAYEAADRLSEEIGQSVVDYARER